MKRRLEDRIRELCRHAVSTYDTEDFFHAIQELRAALREHAARLRTLSEARLLVGLPVLERRADVPGESFETWNSGTSKPPRFKKLKAGLSETDSGEQEDKRAA